MTTINSIADQIIAESHEDYIGLWSIIQKVRDSGIKDSDVVKTTLAIINQLMLDGKIVPGQFQDNTFHMWDLQPKDSIEKINQEWQKLGRDPDIGEIVWFNSPKE